MQSFQPFHPKRALISVSDKEGLVAIGRALVLKGVELVATGQTAAFLQRCDLSVTEVAECTGFPEILDGRVKTLHPNIHAGLLARGAKDQAVLEKAGIKPFDLLIVNLYPFEAVIQQEDSDFAEAIENIDIGGPAMVRAAAKNHKEVLVVVSPKDYPQLIECLNQEKIPAGLRLSFAKKAFAHTAAYDCTIANYLHSLGNDKELQPFPEVLSLQFHQKQCLRYGENPHQKAICYQERHPSEGALSLAEMLQGKGLSYNNLLDADAAFRTIHAFSEKRPCCAIVKHGTPCGIALADTIESAYLRAYQCDPVSSYGGILAFNQTLDAETAKTIIERQFAEVIIAPSLSEDAKAILATKPNIRVLITGRFKIPRSKNKAWELRHIDGGLLVQEQDTLFYASYENANFKTVSKREPTPQEKEDLLFAWACVKEVKSNAIVIAKDGATIGLGAGQTSRVRSARIALWNAVDANFSTEGAVMASDAFIPFKDSLELAIAAGISAVIQPGGSIRDEEMIQCVDEAQVSMVFTGVRHFRH